MRIVYGYTDRAGRPFYGCIDGLVDDALRIFKQFDGNAARLHLLVDEHSMVGWHMHGSQLYEVQVMNDQLCRRRSAQVPNAFAENCIRRVFQGDFELKDLEENAWLYSAGAWDAKADQDYWFYRSLEPDTPATGGAG
jgi:hypothetical protein